MMSRHFRPWRAKRLRQWIRTHPILFFAHIIVGALVIFEATWRLNVADAAPDEFTYRACAKAYLSGSFTCNSEHPPLVKELLAVGISLGHATLADARLTTAIFAVATALFCYLFVTDVIDRIGGLGAAALWGLLPQAGREGSSTLEAIRIDRFALIDPYLAALFAAALFFTWRWITRGGRGYALLCGSSLMLLPLAKAPGLAISLTLLLFAIFGRRSHEHQRRDISLGLLGALVVLIAVYAPLGFHGADAQISYMLHFKFNRAVLVAGHLYERTPWWADLSFARDGVGFATLSVLFLVALYGLSRHLLAAAMALASSLALLLLVALGVHLSSPNYYVEWEPGLVVAAAMGFRSLTTAPSRLALPISKIVAVGTGAALLIAMVGSLLSLAMLKSGPYQRVAHEMRCNRHCLIEYVAYDNIPISYLSPTMDLVLAPPQGHHRLRGNATYVAVDPALYAIRPSWQGLVRHFAANARSFGYRSIQTGTRILLWEKIR